MTRQNINVRPIPVLDPLSKRRYPENKIEKSPFKERRFLSKKRPILKIIERVENKTKRRNGKRGS